MRLICSTVVSLALLFTANAATADDSYRKKTGTRTVMSGVKTKIGQHYHINSDCTAAPMAPTVVIKPPLHGKIEIVKERIFPKANGPLQKCRSVKVSGLVGYYTPKPGYSGKDQFILRSPFGDGKLEDTTINITVLK